MTGGEILSTHDYRDGGVCLHGVTPSFKANLMLILYVPRNQISTHIVHNMDT
jgi:hypothetical protein